MSGIKFSGASSAPSPIGGLDNGLSISTVTGNGELGQTQGDPSNPALVVNTREIPLNGNSVWFSEASLSAEVQIGIANLIGLLAVKINGDSSILPAALILADKNSPGNDEEYYLNNNGGQIRLDASTSGNVFFYSGPAGFRIPKPLTVINTIRGGYLVSNQVANFNAGNLDDSRTLFTNRGAPGAITCTMFNVPNTEYSFYNVTGNPLIVAAQLGVSMRNGGLLKPSPGATLTSNAVGDCIRLRCIGNNEIVATSVIGAWV